MDVFVSTSMPGKSAICRKITLPKQLATLKPGEPLTAPIGTGPYRFVSRSADGVTTLERNPDYKWAPALAANRGAAYFDTSGIGTGALSCSSCQPATSPGRS